MTTTRDLSRSTAFVTGANRGLGRHIAAQLLQRGATVYAGARDAASVDLPGVHPVPVDVTDAASVAAAAQAARGVDLLINNAGSATGADLLTGSLDDLRLELETHYLGSLAVTRAFLPSLREHRGAIANVLSALSWVTYPPVGAYAAAKSAAWSMTSAIRQSLAPEGISVTALHVGHMDTDMAAGVPAEQKSDPADVARALLDGVAAGEHEVLFDATSRQVRQGLSGGVAALYPGLG